MADNRKQKPAESEDQAQNQTAIPDPACGKTGRDPEDRVVQRLEAGIKGYEKISKHALNADASALIVAEAEDDTSS